MTPIPTSWKLTAGVLLTAALVADLSLSAIGLMHGHAALEKLPVFGVVYGLVAAAGLTAVAKLLGKLFLMRAGSDHD